MLRLRLELVRLWPETGLLGRVLAFASGIGLAWLRGAAAAPGPAAIAAFGLPLLWALVLKALISGKARAFWNDPRQAKAALTFALLLFWFIGGFLRQSAAAWPARFAADLVPGQSVSGQGLVKELEIEAAGDYGGPRLKLLLALRWDESAEGMARAWREQNRFLLRVALPEGTDAAAYCREKGLMAGSRVAFSGELDEIRAPRNPGEYDRQKGLAAQGVHCQGRALAAAFQTLERAGPGKRLLERLREGMLERIRRALPNESGGVMAACLLGETGAIEEGMPAYRQAGIAHLFSVSGTHGAIILGLARSLTCRPGGRTKKKSGASLILPPLALFFYLALTGFPLSTQRTFFMALAAQGALWLERPRDSSSALAAAALLLLLKCPQSLLSCGFQLSFGVTWGLIRLMPWLGKRLPGALAASVSAQLAAMPIQAYWFNQIQPAGFVINLFAVALLPVLLCLCLAALFTGLFVPTLSGLLWQAGGFAALVLDHSAKAWSGLPFSGLAVAARGWPGYLLWGMGTWLLPELAGSLRSGLRLLDSRRQARKRGEAWEAWRSFYARKKEAFRRGETDFSEFKPRPEAFSCRSEALARLSRHGRKANGPGLAGLALTLTLVMGLTLAASRPGPLRLCFLDVGQGDCCFLETPRGANWLIDGGSGSVSGLGRYRLLPFLRSQGVNQLDYVVISHPDSDHISGVRELLTLLPVKRLLLSDAAYGEEAGARLAQEAAAAGAEVILFGRGDRIKEGELELICLSPSKLRDEEGKSVDSTAGQTGSNADSLVLHLRYRGFSALFTGDIPAKVELEVLPELVSGLTVLKAAHHGSGSSSCPEFLRGLSPALTIISCGEDNRYGHPHPRVLADLAAVGSLVMETPKTGAVSLWTNGEKAEVSRFVQETSL